MAVSGRPYIFWLSSWVILPTMRSMHLGTPLEVGGGIRSSSSLLFLFRIPRISFYTPTCVNPGQLHHVWYFPFSISSIPLNCRYSFWLGNFFDIRNQSYRYRFCTLHALYSKPSHRQDLDTSKQRVYYGIYVSEIQHFVFGIGWTHTT